MKHAKLITAKDKRSKTIIFEQMQLQETKQLRIFIVIILEKPNHVDNISQGRMWVKEHPNHFYTSSLNKHSSKTQFII